MSKKGSIAIVGVGLVAALFAFYKPYGEVRNHDSISLENVSSLQREVDILTASFPVTSFPPIDTLALKKKYRLIIELYNKGQFNHARRVAGDAFNRVISNNPDELHGYVIAAYYGLGNYKHAAEEVLKRAKRVQSDEQLVALRTDLAMSLRKYARKHSVSEAVALIGELHKRFDSPLLSYFWAVTPLSINDHLSQREHSVSAIEREISEEDIADISTLIVRYPDDQYVDLGYYMLRNYQQALDKKPESPFRDVFLYARGYALIRNRHSAYTGLISETSMNAETKDVLRKAQTYFKQYVAEYQNGKHADDAAYWIAWIEANLGNYDESFIWMDTMRTMGNQDYTRFEYELTENIMERMSTDQLLHYMDHFRFYQIKRVLPRIPVEEAIKLADAVEELERSDYLVSLAIAQFEDLNFQKANEIATMITAPAEKKFFKEYYKEKIERQRALKQIVDQARSEQSVEKYAKAAILARREYGKSKLSIAILNTGIEQLSGKQPVDYLLYLKVLAYKVYNPRKVKEVVETFYDTYRQSKYIDDALAELALVQLHYFDDLEEGEKTVNKLLSSHAKEIWYFSPTPTKTSSSAALSFSQLS